MVDGYVHLHVHTEFSLLDGAAKNKLLFAEAARQEMPAIAMSDHGNMFGAYEFFQTAQKHPVTPIIGIEAYVAPGPRTQMSPVFWSPGGRRPTPSDGEGGKDVSGGGRFTHMTMWARNPQGLRNLFRLSSLASIEGFYGKPRMDLDLIAQHPEGIIATTGCPSGAVQTRLRLGQWDEAVKTAAAYQDIFGKDSYFLELMDHGIAIERDVRDRLLQLARHLNMPLLATNDAHYVTADQADAHDSLLCVGTGKTKDDPERLRFSGDGYYLKTAQQMRALFRELPQACDNTLEIASRIEPYDEVFAHVDRMPQFDVPDGETQASYLRKKIDAGLHQRYGATPSQEVLDRIDLEMSVIDPMGFSSYFLVVADICEHARNTGVPVGPGRGSAPGSIVAYLTGITELDPLAHDLLFERFLNPERINPPDVDLDFDDSQREQMVRYVAERYGRGYTAQVNTFGTIKAKAAVKDAARILGYPYAVGERITKAMPPDQQGKGVPLAGLFDPDHARYGEAADLRALYDAEPDVKKVIDTGMGIEGLIRNTGVHAAAVILSSTPLLDLIPLHKRDKDGAIITGFDFPSCEAMGLVKMDFLGVRNLGIIAAAVNMIRDGLGVDLDITTIPLDDPATYALLARGDTLGVFQLDSSPIRALLRLMAPTEFADVSAVLALYRPGPMAAQAHTNYAHRKNGRQEPAAIHPELREALEPILGSTHHLLVYQEQIMAIAQRLARYTLGGADLLRRAMGKKKPEILAGEWSKFQAGMHASGYSDEATRALWDVMLPFSGYAFNKSHSVSYGLIAYRTAYLKANYPAQYMAALLTSVGDDKDKMAIYLADARAAGIRVLSPDVNESGADFTPVGSDVRFGLQAVRNVGENVITSIVATRTAKGPFASFADFLDKVDLPACNKRAVDSLIKAGAFDSLGHTRRGLVAVAESAIDSVTGVKKQAQHGQDDLFAALDAGDGPGIGLDFTIDPQEWPRKHLLATERDMLGLYVSSHPLDGAEDLLARNRDTSIAELLASERTQGPVRICGLITSVERKTTKQGNPWAITRIADREGEIEVLWFARSYVLVSEALREDTVITVHGTLNERDGSLSIFGDQLYTIDVSTAEAPHPLTLTIAADRITPGLVADLKRAMTAHPGRAPVQLRVEGTDRTTVFGLAFQVDPQTIAAEVKTLLGTAGWAPPSGPTLGSPS